jgi:hypothetical protein
MPKTQIDRWVELHWECTAAMLEAGVMKPRALFDLPDSRDQ